MSSTPDTTVLARLADLELRLAALEARSPRARATGPRDRLDCELVILLARRIGGREFTCRWLLRHARVDAELRGALDATDLDSPRALGQWLRRLRDISVEGFVLRRRETERQTRPNRRRWWVQSA